MDDRTINIIIPKRILNVINMRRDRCAARVWNQEAGLRRARGGGAQRRTVTVSTGEPPHPAARAGNTSQSAAPSPSIRPMETRSSGKPRRQTAGVDAGLAEPLFISYICKISGSAQRVFFVCFLFI